MSSEKKEKKQHKMNFNIKEKLKKTFSKEHLKEVFTGEEQKKHLKQGSYSSIMTVIVLAVIVVINLIVAQIPTSKTQIDLNWSSPLRCSCHQYSAHTAAPYTSLSADSEWYGCCAASLERDPKHG